ncbi:unnamed protein product [Urochloa decumbens]|uniref:F-box domain-containing protein n=1 Tax=Urochloa decumbens TaxID=240449 RepID=A0ABC9C5Q2_9POAL
MDNRGVKQLRDCAGEDGEQNRKEVKMDGAGEEEKLPDLVSSLPITNPTTSLPPVDRGEVKRQRDCASEDVERNGTGEEEKSPELVSSLPTPNPTTSPPSMDRRGVKRLMDGAGVDGDRDREFKKAKSEALEEEESDLVSSLPLELACDIFSRLSTIDGVSTTAVCHTWKQIWLATPISVNDGELVVGPGDTEKRKMIIDCIIKSHPLPFGRFKCSFLRLTPILMANWELWFADPRFDSIDELVLLFRRGVHTARGPLPHTALRFPIVRVIILANCRIPSGSEIVSPRLSVLELRNVVISSDTMQGILSRCHKLETLKLIRNIGIVTLSLKLKRLCRLYVLCHKKELTHLTIMEAESLEEFYVNQFAYGPLVVIDSAPMLRTLGYIGLETPSFDIGDSMFRQSSAIKVTGHCTSVTTLAVKMFLPDLEYIADFLNLFPYLETLHILFVDRSQLTYPSERSAGETCLSNREGQINCLNNTLRNLYFWNHPEIDHHTEFTNYFIERCSVLKSMVFATKEWHWSDWTDQMNLKHLASPRVQFYFASYQHTVVVGRLPIMENDPFGLPVSVYQTIM